MVKIIIFYLACSSSILYNDYIWLLLLDFSPIYFYKYWILFYWDLSYFYDICSLLVYYRIVLYNFYMNFLDFYYYCFDWLNEDYNYWILFLCYFILSFEAINLDYKLLIFLLLIYILSAFYLVFDSSNFLLFFCSSLNVY